EADVPSLIRYLGRKEDLHLLGRNSRDDRPKLVGDLLLADEKGGQPVHALEPLFLRKATPVGAILPEVDVLRAPLLALPKLVELSVGQELSLGAVSRFLKRRISRLAEELALL